MSYCGDWEELLLKAVDGVLSPEEHLKLERHLADCPHCSATLADHRLLRSLAQTLSELEPPIDLSKRILQQIHQTTRLPKPWYRNHWLQAAGLLLLGASGFYLLERIEFQPQLPKQSPAAEGRISNTSKPSVPDPSKPVSSPATKSEPLSPPESRPRLDRFRKGSPPDSPQEAPAKSPQPLSGFAPPPPSDAPSAKSQAAPAPSAAPPPSQHYLEPDLQEKRKQDKEYSAGAALEREAQESKLQSRSAEKKTVPGIQRHPSPSPKSETADSDVLRIQIEVRNSETAKEAIQKALAKAEAEILTRSARQLTCRLSSEHLRDLMLDLARIGKLVQAPPKEKTGSKDITLLITW